uniref:Late endosomal/lysosomal adaptor and MAPK and MTOR activator 4 n=1 Tax=Panagrolaimus sp. JU765 TaxID=591449 RepID=A0AC34R957_9BILA
MNSKSGEIGQALSQGKDVLGVLVVEDDVVVQKIGDISESVVNHFLKMVNVGMSNQLKIGDISESVVNHFLKMVNVGMSNQLVSGEQFQTMNIIYPYKCSYAIGVAGKRIYITKRSISPAPDEDESKA